MTFSSGELLLVVSPAASETTGEFVIPYVSGWL